MPKFKTNLLIQDIPSDPNHASRIQDVNNTVGKYYKDPVICATISNLTYLTYYPAQLELRDSMEGMHSIDGVELDTAGLRVLIKNQTDAMHNGIYDVITPGDESNILVLRRSSDFDSDEDIHAGCKIYVLFGENGTKTFVLDGDYLTGLTSSKYFHLDSGMTGFGKEVIRTMEGDGTTKSFDITHNFNNYNVTVEIFDNDTNEEIFTDIEYYQNKITVKFGNPLESGEELRAIIRVVK